MSTVPYTATAVLLTVTIRSQTVPYINHIDELETPCQYGTVITTAGIRLMTAVWDREKSKFVTDQLISYKRIERHEYNLINPLGSGSKAKLLFDQHQSLNCPRVEACTAERNCTAAP